MRPGLATACPRGFGAALAALLVTPPAAAAPAAPVVLQVDWRGGMCPGGMCRSTARFHADGSYTLQHLRGAGTKGKVAPALIAAVRAEAARADFTAIKAVKFTGTCPMAWDGQETIYTFTTPGGRETIPSCKYVVDPKLPLFVAADRLIAACGYR